MAKTRVSKKTVCGGESRSFDKINRYKDDIIANISSAIVIINKNLEICSANRIFQAMLQLKQKEISKVSFCKAIGCEKCVGEKCKIKNSVGQILNGKKKTVNFECVIEVKGGEISLQCRIGKIFPGNNLLLIMDDITRNKLIELRLLQSERLAATGRLAASIAHEINNPLQGITVHLDIIKESLPLEFKEMESFSCVKDNVEKIRDIVRQLLDIYRQSNKEKAPVDMNVLIQKVVSLVDNQILMKGVNLSLKLSGEEVVVTGWPPQLHQLFLNLILNAIEHTDKGGSVIISTLSGKGSVRIEVSDTGRGIRNKDIRHIFDPFFSTKKESGVGLGLFVCQGIAKNHKGAIEVESRLGKGSRFTVTLPKDYA